MSQVTKFTTAGWKSLMTTTIQLQSQREKSAAVMMTSDPHPTKEYTENVPLHAGRSYFKPVLAPYTGYFMSGVIDLLFSR
jgi:hypothetical protein